MTVQALFVDGKGIYPELLGRENCWAGEDDYWPDAAREYGKLNEKDPVVCHPICGPWINMAAVNWKRYGKQKPAWYPGGTDGGCFESALANVRRVGGIIEQPAGSHAWAHHCLMPPKGIGWSSPEYDLDTLDGNGFIRYWVCEVLQVNYGHPCRKRTWLLYCGKRPPFDLRWGRTAVATHQIGFQDRRGKAKNKPTISGRAASATPRAFAEELIRLAEWSTGK